LKYDLYSYDSCSFNIQGTIFCQLFSHLIEETKQIIDAQTGKKWSTNSFMNNLDKQ
jgi:hypothetical protein